MYCRSLGFVITDDPFDLAFNVGIGRAPPALQVPFSPEYFDQYQSFEYELGGVESHFGLRVGNIVRSV